MNTEIIWSKEIENINRMITESKTLDEIGKHYGVSRQRIYQVFTKYGISTLSRKRKNFLREKHPKYYWLNKILNSKGVNKVDRLNILENLEIPDFCPILGLELNYNGTGMIGWTRQDNSPSIDRIDSRGEYELNNIQIISWRANRIKNDSTPEELRKLADYMEALEKSKS